MVAGKTLQWVAHHCSMAVPVRDNLAGIVVDMKFTLRVVIERHKHNFKEIVNT